MSEKQPQKEPRTQSTNTPDLNSSLVALCNPGCCEELERRDGCLFLHAGTWLWGLSLVASRAGLLVGCGWPSALQGRV